MQTSVRKCAHLNFTLSQWNTVDSSSLGQELSNHIIFLKIRQKLKIIASLLTKGTISIGLLQMLEDQFFVFLYSKACIRIYYHIFISRTLVAAHFKQYEKYPSNTIIGFHQNMSEQQSWVPSISFNTLAFQWSRLLHIQVFGGIEFVTWVFC